MTKFATVLTLGAATLAATAGTALGQTACGGAPGPDVIVGVITGPTNYTVTGSGATALEALSLGTTSCNMGTQTLMWNASPANTHPVIGGHLYKFKVVNGSGRFEQIGLSWLKHGFTALANSDCCTCQNPGTGTRLGIGCSDPYTSSRNGTQTGLGPRWTVNAATGFYPATTPVRPSGGNAGRLEVLVSDLEPSSAAIKYFGEAQYVTPDDSTANGGLNNNNNASNIGVTVSGSGTVWTFGFTGTTNRQMAAIRQWPLQEAGVTLTDIDVPGDGLFTIASKATDLGGGQWHYEYAVYNMNSDRNGGTFSVPVPVGAAVSNIGFHDVTYRYGDGNGNVSFSSTDWNASVSGGAVTWSTEDQAVNNNANAIRWGTTYNFRFDANMPPAASGNVSLGLWKAGSPASISAAAAVPSCGTAAGFSAGPTASTVCPGQNATFTATATGTAPAHLWQRETSPGVYTNLSDGFIAGLGTVSGSATDTLLVTAVEAGASGNIRDTATNACGSVNGNPALLTVRAVSDPLCGGGPICDGVDFNGDSLTPDSTDIDDFLSVFSGGPCSTGTCGDIDFNNDGLFPDTSDVDALLSVFSGGPCI